MIDKRRPRKLNATADSRLRKEDEMQDALNLVSSNDYRAEGDTTEGNDSTGNSGVLKPTRGNVSIPPFNYEGFGGETKKRVLGSVTDHAHNVVYFFVWVETAADQGVYAYDPTGYLPGSDPGSESMVKVFTSSLFKFPSDGFIKADIVHINKPISVTNYNDQQRTEETQPVLYFTDNVNEPRKLHPFRALTENLDDYVLVDVKDFITACPKTPLYPIIAQFERDATDATTAFEGLPGFQFAYQHIYKGGEESALSTFSDIAVPQAYYRQGASSSADLYANNKCVLTIPSAITYMDEEGQPAALKEVVRTKEVAAVRILRRVGNSGTWGVVDEVLTEELEAADNKYLFYNRSIAAGFPAQTAIKPYDNIPQKAQAQAVVSDRLAYGNYVEGYDNLKVTASASVTYHNRPEDFKELDIRIVPTIKKASESEFTPSWGATINKRCGWYIDTSEMVNILEKGSIIQLDFSVKPMRNYHFYNGINSFHGSRHLSLDIGVDDGNPSLSGLSGPEVHGLGATEAETRGSEEVNKDLNHMFGANNGVSIPGLKWRCVASQSTNSDVYSEHDVVFGTSAANPFILRGASLHFSVNVRLKMDTFTNELRKVLSKLLTSEVPLVDGVPDPNSLLSQFQQERIEVISVKNNSEYQIDEGLPGGTFTTNEDTSISAPFEIPVALNGDDRKHLIVALGHKNRVNSNKHHTDLVNQSPCGYFIVNRADVNFGLSAPSGYGSENGFLELDLKGLANVDVQTAIPFINAERWKDQAYEANHEGCNNDIDGAGNNDERNWGLKDACLWSLDSLIVDSWFCYSREFLEGSNLHHKIFTPNSTDFPRFMNGYNIDPDDAGDDDTPALLRPGDMNPEVTSDGRGLNCCVLDFQENSNYMFNLAVGDTNTDGNLNPNYKYRRNAVGAPFKQTHKMPFLQAIAIDAHGSIDGNGQSFLFDRSLEGRNLIIGYLTNPDVYDLDNNIKPSIIDGCMGPGGARDGVENVRKIEGGGTNYAVGSVTGEMIFTGRISPMGYFRPEKMKTGRRQNYLVNFNAGFDEYFHQYGLGPVLPYFGGVGYQKVIAPSHGPADGVTGTDVFAVKDIGFILAWFYAQSATCNSEELDDSIAHAPYHEEPNLLSNLNAVYVGDDEHVSEWVIVDEIDDLKSSIRIGDAPISLTGREFGIFGGDEWKAGGRSFKTRANHAFGIVYYDERGRSGKVNPLMFTDGEGSGAPASPGVYIKGYSPNERGDVTKNGRVSINIDLSDQTPPDWAFNYQIVYGGNTTKSNFIQYSIGGAFVANKNLNEEGGEEGEDPSSTNIYVSLNYLQGNKDVSYSEAFGAVSPLGAKDLYTYKPGDKLRVLSYYRRSDARVWAEDIEFEVIGVENVSKNPEQNIFRRAFELDDDNNVVADCRSGQFLVLKNNPKAEGFNYSSVKAAGNKAHTNVHKWNNICVVEIYSPAKDIDVEDKLFYEIGTTYPVRKRINTDEEGGLVSETLHHHGLDADNNDQIITLTKGDVWFKPVALATAEFGENPTSESGEPLPAYNKFANLIKKGLDGGESSPRFKNYYVESLTFNDTFAGNNVIGIGKPNNVDKEVMQIRKSSSITHSDKHNFAKKGIKFTSFNGTTSNWKDLSGEFGKINFLQNNYDSLICIQENKSSTIPVERNIISDASGGNTLITTNKVVGVQSFYAGEYGCDNNPESVVKNDAAVYFASKAKSEVYRLTSKGVEVVSKLGLSSYFFRIFEAAKKNALDGNGKIYVPGGYDPLKDEFLITISNLTEETTSGEQSVSQGQFGTTFVQVLGCMDPDACNYNPEANVDDGNCVLPLPIEVCMDPMSLTYNPHISGADCTIAVSTPSLCAYFDFCVFDFLSEQQDGLVDLDDITYCYNDVVYSSSGANTLSDEWEGLVGEDTNILGLGLQWLIQQPTVTIEDGKITGGTFKYIPTGEFYTVPMSWTGPGGPGNSGYDASDIGWTTEFTNQGITGLMKALFQQFAGGPGESIHCPTYGCPVFDFDPNSEQFVPDNDINEAPPHWLGVINNPLYSNVDEDEIPWGVTSNCE